METIPEVKIEGLEEVIASLTALSQAIDHLGQSAKETLQAFAASPEPGAPVVGPGDSSGLSGAAATRASPLAQDLSSALSAVLVPELNQITTVLSETLAAFKATTPDTAIGTLSVAVTSLETSAEALKGATDDMREAVQDLSSRPMLVSGLTPDQLQTQLGALADNQGVASNALEIMGDSAISTGVRAALTGQVGAGVLMVC